jgi:hypothetical protein
VKVPSGEFYSADFGAGLAEGSHAPAQPKAHAAPANVDDSALRLIGTSPSMQKVRDLIAPVLGARQAQVVIDRVNALDSVSDVRELIALMTRRA